MAWKRSWVRLPPGPPPPNSIEASQAVPAGRQNTRALRPHAPPFCGNCNYTDVLSRPDLRRSPRRQEGSDLGPAQPGQRAEERYSARGSWSHRSQAGRGRRRLLSCSTAGRHRAGLGNGRLGAVRRWQDRQRRTLHRDYEEPHWSCLDWCNRQRRLRVVEGWPADGLGGMDRNLNSGAHVEDAAVQTGGENRGDDEENDLRQLPIGRDAGRLGRSRPEAR